jgi:thiamine pyrophosphate-dependent acetolactate synthase large subunit-like protein
MRYSISDTAEFGDYVSGPRIVTNDTREAMQHILADVQSGAFARRWMEEHQSGRDWFNKTRSLERAHPVEVIGAQVRDLMPFVQPIVVDESGAISRQAARAKEREPRTWVAVKKPVKPPAVGFAAITAIAMLFRLPRAQSARLSDL